MWNDRTAVAGWYRIVDPVLHLGGSDPAHETLSTGLRVTCTEHCVAYSDCNCCSAGSAALTVWTSLLLLLLMLLAAV
jgi:hypothetical protein